MSRVRLPLPKVSKKAATSLRRALSETPAFQEVERAMGRVQEEEGVGSVDSASTNQLPTDDDVIRMLVEARSELDLAISHIRGTPMTNLSATVHLAYALDKTAAAMTDFHAKSASPDRLRILGFRRETLQTFAPRKV